MFSNKSVEEEYSRWANQIGPEQSFGVGLTTDDILQVHFVLVDMFYRKQSGLGGIGPKSMELLQSAVSRQFVSFEANDKWSRPEEVAATLMYGIILNHPFHDANKRTAFLATLLLLNRNKLVPKIKEKQFEDFTVLVAERGFKNHEKFKRSFEGQEDAEVKYIAHYLRLAFRQSDKRDYVTTYRELSTILGRFGYELQNPHGNTIDVVCTEGPDIGRRVCNIGFHGWTKQIAKGVIRYVRSQTQLDILNGVDSAAFFRGEEPINNLLARYYEPLERLAFR